jgi:hypothetical protein
MAGFDINKDLLKLIVAIVSYDGENKIVDSDGHTMFRELFEQISYG